MNQPFKPYLPGILSYIADEIDPETAILLAQKRGGRVVYIPQQPAENHVLCEIIGFEKAIALSKLLGHGNLLVPMGNIGGANGRHARVVDLLNQGLSHSAIAGEVDVHIRTVERIAAQHRDDAQFGFSFDIND